ncbi:MAG: glycosyltransferase [Desulfomonilaceae bacterium]|nr:glycosyltransferase [Desulfomonilaceae bacterium]
MKDIVVVVPCYNEARRLDGSTFLEFCRANTTVTFVFVNDGSTDETSEVLADVHAQAPKQVVIHELHDNSGKAEAVRQGVLNTSVAGFRYVGMWDADLAAPLDELLLFRDILDNLPTLQMVIGSRVRMLGRTICRSPLRHYFGRIAATVISMVLKLPVYDTQCGAKLFRATPNTVALFEEPFISRWLLDVELIARMVKAHRNGLADSPERLIYESPLKEWTERSGSKIRPRDYLVAFQDLMVIKKRYL